MLEKDCSGTFISNKFGYTADLSRLYAFCFCIIACVVRSAFVFLVFP
jgi:hypothetical protein